MSRPEVSEEVARSTAKPDWYPDRPWACEGGTLVLKYDAPREAWLEARKTLLGASDPAAVFGLSKWDDAYGVWADKTGRRPNSESNRAQMRGLLFEENVVKLWTMFDADFPIEYRRKGLMRSRAYPVLGASVDFLSTCPEGRCVIEVKTQNDTREWEDDEVPVIYQFQGQQQLLATGRDHVHFLALGNRFAILHRVMYRDNDMIGAMGPRLTTWWEEHVVADVAPEVTTRSTDTIKQIYATYLDAERAELPEDLWFARKTEEELKAQIAELQASLSMLQADLQHNVGKAEVATIEGHPVAQWSRTKKIVGADAAFRKKHAELIQPYLIPSTDLDLARLIAEHPELIEEGILRQQRTWKWLNE